MGTALGSSSPYSSPAEWAVVRRLSRPSCAAALAATCATGCIDFADPNIPGISDRGSSAVFEARVIVTDSGRVNVDARLAPGLDFDGFRRPVTAPRLDVLDRGLEPDSVGRDGTLRYLESWGVGRSALLGPITLLAPSVDGVRAPPPAVEWFSLRNVGPDSIRLRRGDDLHLAVAEVEGISSPQPSIRQWFLTLSSGDRSFRLGSDGVPPNPISVPPQWIPEGDTVHVRLIFNQQGILSAPPEDYVGVITADTWLFWTVLVDSGP